MKLKSDQLLKKVYDMRSDVRAKVPLSHLEVKYKVLNEEYPYLFKMISENTENCMEMFKKMITLLQMIENGTKTREESDKIMGIELAKEFIYEKLDMTKEEPMAIDPVFEELPSDEEA